MPKLKKGGLNKKKLDETTEQILNRLEAQRRYYQEARLNETTDKYSNACRVWSFLQ